MYGSLAEVRLLVVVWWQLQQETIIRSTRCLRPTDNHKDTVVVNVVVGWSASVHPGVVILGTHYEVSIYNVVKDPVTHLILTMGEVPQLDMAINSLRSPAMRHRLDVGIQPLLHCSSPQFCSLQRDILYFNYYHY